MSWVAMSKPTPPDALPTLDAAALAQVTGGTSSASTDSSAVMSALTGILDSIKSLSSHQSQGFNPQEMMMFMMMLQQRNQTQVVQQPAAPCVGPNGYWLF
jgi:hypothetical protein